MRRSRRISMEHEAIGAELQSRAIKDRQSDGPEALQNHIILKSSL